MELRLRETEDLQATQQATFLGPLLVLAQGGEFVLSVIAWDVGCLLPSASWRLVQIFFVG